MFRAIKFLNKLKRLKHREGFEAYGSMIRFLLAFSAFCCLKWRKMLFGFQSAFRSALDSNWWIFDCISLFNAIFLLIFVAHFLGCGFSYILFYEPGGLWLVPLRDLTPAPLRSCYAVGVFMQQCVPFLERLINLMLDSRCMCWSSRFLLVMPSSTTDRLLSDTNWLIHYNPDIVSEDTFSRYVTGNESYRSKYCPHIAAQSSILSNHRYCQSAANIAQSSQICIRAAAHRLCPALNKSLQFSIFLKEVMVVAERGLCCRYSIVLVHHYHHHYGFVPPDYTPPSYYAVIMIKSESLILHCLAMERLSRDHSWIIENSYCTNREPQDLLDIYDFINLNTFLDGGASFLYGARRLRSCKWRVTKRFRLICASIAADASKRTPSDHHIRKTYIAFTTYFADLWPLQSVPQCWFF